MFQTPDPRRDDPTVLDEPIVWQEITRVARAALRRAADGDTAAPSSLRARVRGSAIDGDTWAVRAQPLLQAAHDQPVVVVAIERVNASTESDEVRRRFDLSPRQAEVATLLARRYSDKEIAARLGISRHTARRHVELVMMRLRVHSRAEVGELLGQFDDTRLAVGSE
jgi:DNA-binding CsgD family transcriptional regulator